MYKIIVYTSQLEFYIKTDEPSLPNWEFLKTKNAYWQVCYVNRNEIIFYRVIQIEWKDEK